MPFTMTPTTKYLAARSSGSTIGGLRVELGTGNTRAASDFATATGLQTKIGSGIYGNLIALDNLNDTVTSFDAAFGVQSTNFTAQEAGLFGTITGDAAESLTCGGACGGAGGIVGIGGGVILKEGVSALPTNFAFHIHDHTFPSSRVLISELPLGGPQLYSS